MSTPNPGSDEAVRAGCTEEFRPVAGYELRYEVSNLGRVVSLRHHGNSGCVGFLRPRWTRATPGRNNGRYASVRLIDRARGLDCQFRIHRLVAVAFVPNPLGLPEVNHISGDTEDNRAANLEWVTRADNQRHAIASGLASAPNLATDKGQRYAWRNEDGRVFWGTPAMLSRAFPCDQLNTPYLYKIVNPKYAHHKSLHGWRIIPTPTPGSADAIAMGDVCPVIDNHHGEGVPSWPFPWQEGRAWWISEDCPVHRAKEQQ